MSHSLLQPEITADQEAVFARTGFKQSGFGGPSLRTTQIAVWIVATRSRYGVYICHGEAGGQFWRNSAPIVSHETLEAAREAAESIYGIFGSGVLAKVVVDY